MVEEDDNSKVAAEERQVVLELPGSPDAPRAARAAVHELLADRSFREGHLDTLMLLVSEVVTNAITHPGGEGAIELSVAVTGSLTRVVVSDTGAGFEWPPDPAPGLERDGGFGLIVLEKASSRWGTLSSPGRFSVWFELDHTELPHRS